MRLTSGHTWLLMVLRSSFFIGLFSSIASCQRANLDPDALQKLKQNYSNALENALVNVPCARDFKKTFASSCEFFSSFTGEYGPPTLNCKASLYGRYVFTMHVHVTFDSSRTKVISYGAPTFYLEEVLRISPLPDGRVTINSESIKEFDDELWKIIVEHGGDFSSAGIPLKKDAPVSGFEEHWREV